MLSITLIGVTLSYATAAHSTMTGADFLQAPPSYQSGFINGFVRGMYATCLDHLEAKKEVCSFGPVLDAAFDMTPEQVLNIFLSYLRRKTEFQPKEASELLVDCLKEAAQKPSKSQ
jgi:hypothetical protein